MPNGLPDSFEPIKQDDKGLPDTFEPITETKTAPTLGFTQPPSVDVPYDVSRDTLANTLNPIAGFFGLPKIGKDPLKSYDIGELIGTGLPILGGGIAAVGAYKYGKRILGAGSTIAKEVPVIKTEISNAVKGLTEELNPIQKLNNALKESVPLNKQQAELYTAERGKRIAQVKEVNTPGISGHYERKSKLSGELPKVKIEPLSNKITPDDLNELVTTIYNHPGLLDYEQIHAADGLEKLYNGGVPQPSQIKHLSEVFGTEFPEALVQHAKLIQRNWYQQGQDFLKNIITSFDFSPLGRQGKPFITNKEYWTSIDDMVKSWGSEDFFKSLTDSIHEHPNFKRPVNSEGKVSPSVAERAGLRLPSHEEMMNSSLAERLVPGVRRSNRAYSGFLNKLRSDLFNNMVSKAEAAGEGVLRDNVKLKQIGDLINTLSGSGSLGKLERYAPLLNETFFAPRLMSSRVKMWKMALDPRTYYQLDSTVRKQALRSLLATTGFGLLTGEAAKLAGATVSNNIYSSDFRKIKIGDKVRMDTLAGTQQYGVAAAKFLMGKSTGTESNKTTDLTAGKFGQSTRKDVAERFVAGKLNPVPSFVWSWMNSKEFDGTPFEVKQGIVNRTVPYVIQDIQELYKEDPSLFPLGIMPIIGEGLQTYGR